MFRWLSSREMNASHGWSQPFAVHLHLYVRSEGGGRSTSSFGLINSESFLHNLFLGRDPPVPRNPPETDGGSWRLITACFGLAFQTDWEPLNRINARTITQRKTTKSHLMERREERASLVLAIPCRPLPPLQPQPKQPLSRLAAILKRP